MTGRERRAVRVGLVQMRCAVDRAENLARAVEMIREAAGRGAELVCLPELFLSRYFCQTEDHVHFDLAEPIPGPATDQLGKLAAELGISLVSSLFEKRAEGLYHNTAVVHAPTGEMLGRYRKMHIPDDPLFYEKFYFTPGDLGFKVFPTPAAAVGTLVCWDQWFPEAARLTALRGADLLVYPTAIGWHPTEKAEFGNAQHGSWEVMQRSHAVANGCYVCAINRIGHEPDPTNDGPEGGIEFWGQSFIAAPDGEVVVRGSTDREEVLVEELDLGRIDTARTHWPFLRDRRIDAYGDLERRFVDEDAAR